MTPTGTPHPRPLRRVLPENAHGPLVPDGLPNPLGRKAIFDFLVLGGAKPRFLPGHAAQLAGTGQKGLADRLDNGIQLFLGEGAKDLLRFLRLLPQLPWLPAGKPNPDPW